MPPIVTVGGETYSSATIETIRVATGAPVIAVKAGPAEYKQFCNDIIQSKQIPNGQIWLRWNKQFERISVVDEFDIVQGKTVILGITAEGIGPRDCNTKR